MLDCTGLVAEAIRRIAGEPTGSLHPGVITECLCIRLLRRVFGVEGWGGVY